MLTTTFAPTVLIDSAPIVHGCLAYADYIKGADADAEPHTELACELGQAFEGSYIPEVLAQVLREIQPQVLLTEMEDEGVLRTDFPIVSDADLDAIDLRACELTTQATCAAA